MSFIYLYQDYVHNNGTLFRMLSGHYGADNVRQCDASDILAGVLDDARLLVVPGGADLYYCEKLNGEGNRRIRAYVENGGAYLGMCAGAYYACASIDWGNGEIAGPRALAFYKGKAVGPVYDFIEDGNIEKSWDAAVQLSHGDLVYPVLYSGGPLFSGDPDAQVLASYASLPGRPAAIVKCAVGKGFAILSSPHLEFDALQYTNTLYRHRNPSYDWQKRVAAQLEQGTKQQKEGRAALLDEAVANR